MMEQELMQYNLFLMRHFEYNLYKKKQPAALDRTRSANTKNEPTRDYRNIPTHHQKFTYDSQSYQPKNEQQASLNSPPETSGLKWLTHFYVPCSTDSAQTIQQILRMVKTSFTKAVVYAKDDTSVSNILTSIEKEFKAVVIRRSHRAEEREKKFIEFVLNESRVLITSEQPRRSFKTGLIDVEGVNVIVNQVVPDDAEEYKSRCLRALEADAESRGICVNLIARMDSMNRWKNQKVYNMSTIESIQSRLNIQMSQLNEHTYFESYISKRPKLGGPRSINDRQVGNLRIYPKDLESKAKEDSTNDQDYGNNKYRYKDEEVVAKSKKAASQDKWKQQTKATAYMPNKPQPGITLLSPHEQFEDRESSPLPTASTTHQNFIQKMVTELNGLAKSTQSAVGRQEIQLENLNGELIRISRVLRQASTSPQQIAEIIKNQLRPFVGEVTAKMNESERRLAQTVINRSESTENSIIKKIDSSTAEIKSVILSQQKLGIGGPKAKGDESSTEMLAKLNSIQATSQTYYQSIVDKIESLRSQNHQLRNLLKELGMATSSNKKQTADYDAVCLKIEKLNEASKQGSEEIKRQIRQFSKMTSSSTIGMQEVLEKKLETVSTGLSKQITQLAKASKGGTTGKYEEEKNAREIIELLKLQLAQIERLYKNANSLSANSENQKGEAQLKKYAEQSLQFRNKIEQMNMKFAELSNENEKLRKQLKTTLQRSSQMPNEVLQFNQILMRQLDLSKLMKKQNSKQNVVQILSAVRALKECRYFLSESRIYEGLESSKKEFLNKSIRRCLYRNPKNRGKEIRLKTKTLFEGERTTKWDYWLSNMWDKAGGLLMLLVLENNQIICSFSEYGIPSRNNKEPNNGSGFMASISNLRIYDLKETKFGKALKYDDYMFVVGNNEILVKSNLTFSVIFNKQFCFYEYGDDELKQFLGEDKDEGKFRRAEFHQVFFDASQ